VAVGIVTFLACVLQYYFTRERVTEEGLQQTEKEKISVGKQLKAVASDKFWWVIVVFYLLVQFSGAVKNLSMVYFCQEILKPFLGLDAGAMQSVLAVLGAIPMAVAVVVIWPLSNKFNKQIVTLVGMLVGVAGGVLAGLFPENFVLVGVGVALKCLGSAPACYMILAMISDVLDHLEAKHGFRADGLTMSIYSSIMVAATPVGQAIFNLVSNSGQNTAMLSVCYIWLETVAFGLGAALMIFFGVEKHLESDQKHIRERQKAQAEAEGREWIEPEELLRRQEEEAERLAEEARKAELKVRCERKGLNFDEEERKYQEKLTKRKK
jgi:Na+/melibiose symporter-like transporter